MKKLAIFASIATLGMFTAVGLTSNKPIEVKAEGEESSLVQSSEPVESSVSSEQQVSSSVEASSEEPVESSQEASDPVEETSSATTSKPGTWEEIKDVKVEGKTIKEWIDGIKNEETRRSTLFALAIAVIVVVLTVLKWLTEHGLLKKNNLVAQLNLKSIEDVKALNEKAKQQTEEALVKAKEQFEEAQAKTKEEFALAQEKMREELVKAQEIMAQQEARIAEQANKIEALVGTDTKERDAIRNTLLEMTKDSKDYVAAGTYKKVRSFLGVNEDGKEE